MNILLLIAELDRGGAETHVFELASALVRRGHSVTVASEGGRLVIPLCQNGVSHVTLPLGKKSAVAMIKSLGGLKILLSARDFDIVHAHSRIAALVAERALLSSNIRAAFVTTIHASFRESALLHSLSRWGRATVAVSEDLKQYLLCHSRDVLAENIRVIPNGVDTERFSPANKREGETRIVFLSRLDRDCSEAAYSLCRIARALDKRYRRLKIVIGGGGEEYANIRNTAQNINRAVGRELIETVGHVDRPHELMRSADVFVGVSRAALEAMACAVPVVLAGNEGFLGVLDADALALAETTNFCCRGSARITDKAMLDSLVQTLDMPRQSRAELGGLLREYVLERHSTEHMCRETEAFYRSVMHRQRDAKQSVLLCGYYGFGNMGDDVLLVRAIQRAEKRFDDMPVCALTRNGRADSRRFGVRCAKRSSPVAILRELRHASVVVFGGGTLLQNSTSGRSLRYYLLLLSLAQRAGKRTELWANGVGNIRGRASRRMTASVLAKCSFVGLRDRESLDALNELLAEHRKPLPQVAVEDDLAMCSFREDRARLDYILRSLRVPSERRIAVIAVRGVEKHGYVKILERFVRSLAVDGVLPIFIVMYPEQDLELTRKIARDCGGKIAYPIGASDTVALMRHAELVCGMRYHALVFAYLAATPFIGFGGESKIESFCHSHSGKYWLEIEGRIRGEPS